MLTFKSILNNEKNLKEKKALLANKVEDMLNTVIRQIAFFEFEKQIHTKRKQSELTVEQICNIWMEVQKQSLGPSIEFEEEYAFGDCLVNSLYGVYEEGLINFDTKYINLLESGGSQRYRELLKPFNLNPSKSSFWIKGISVIENFIDELEEL